MHAVGRRMFSPATAPARRRRGFVVIGLAKLLEGEKMDDKQVVAAILALALHSAGTKRPRKRDTERWRDVWRDYNRFLKQLEKSDDSINARGINPD